MARNRGCCQISGGLRLSVHPQRRQRSILGIGVGCCPVEDVVAGEVHQGQGILGADPGQGGDAGGVGRPGLYPSGSGFGFVDPGVGAGIDDRGVGRPVVACQSCGIGEVEFGAGGEVHVFPAGEAPLEGRPELASRPEDQRLQGGDRCDISQTGVLAVLGGKFRPFKRDRPVDGCRFIGEVQERVLLEGCGRPMVVDQVGVGGIGFECLEGVADPAGHEDCCGGIHLQGEDLPEGFPGT